MDFGGIEKYVATLAETLCNDFKIEIISTYDTGNVAFEIPKNVSVKYLIHEKPDTVSLKKMLRSLNFVGFFKELKRRRKLRRYEDELSREVIENLDSDIVITVRIMHSLLVGKYCKNDSILKIATEHNFHQNNQSYIDSVVESVKGFDYLILPTEELRDSYSCLIGDTKCLVMSIPLTYIPKKKSQLMSKNIISIGRFSPEKGFLDLVEIMDEVNKIDKDIKLFLIGDGYQNSQIQKKIDELDLRHCIETPGFLKQQEMSKYFLDSSLYVLSSITEAFGLVLIEAMSYGLPCVAFDSASGARELLKDDIGILIKDRNKEEMASMIIELVNDKKKLKEMQKNLESFMGEFTIEKSRTRWLELLK